MSTRVQFCGNLPGVTVPQTQWMSESMCGRCAGQCAVNVRVRIAQEQHVGGQGQGLLLSRHGGTDVSVPKGGVVGSMMQASEPPWKTHSEQERRKRTVSSCRGHGQKWSAWGSWRECAGDWGSLGGGWDMAWDRVWESVWELGKVGEAGRGSGRGSCVFG